MSETTFYILHKENPVHAFLLDTFKEGRTVQYSEGIAKSLSKFRYKTLGVAKSLLVIDKLKPSNEVAKAIATLSTHNRLVIFQTATKAEVQFLKSIEAIAPQTKEMATYKSWADKELLCQQFLEEISYTFKTSKVYKQCIRLIVRDFERFPQYLKDLKLLAEQGEEIQEQHLLEIFDNTEIFPLDDWTLAFLKGEQPRKTLQGLDYFLHTKGYSEQWLCNHMFQWVKRLTLFYDARNKGIFFNEKVMDNFMKRAEVLKVSYIHDLKQLSSKEQRLAIEWVAKVPAQEFYLMQQAFMHYAPKTAVELHQLFLHLHIQKQERKEISG